MLDVDPAVVVGAARTAIGTYGGSLSGIDAYKLGAVTIKESLSRASVETGEVDEVVWARSGRWVRMPTTPREEPPQPRRDQPDENGSRDPHA